MKGLLKDLFWCTVGCLNTILVVIGFAIYCDIKDRLDLSKTKYTRNYSEYRRGA